jgi:hypothetical protein
MGILRHRPQEFIVADVRLLHYKKRQNNKMKRQNNKIKEDNKDNDEIENNDIGKVNEVQLARC